MIPKNIALFYHDKSKMTPTMKKNYEVLKITHPDFNVELYDDNEALEFIKKNFDQRTVRAYESLRVYSEESQMFRYCYIYKKGGVFLDIKYECVVNFNFSRLMDREYFCSEQHGIYMGFFVLKPFNPVVNALITNISKFTEISYNIVGLCKVTGAEAIKDLLIENKSLAEELLWVRIGDKSAIFLEGKIILKEYKNYKEDFDGLSEHPIYQNNRNKIPKQIFMCDKTLHYIAKYSENWRRLNPEYAIKLYDDNMCASFLLTEFTQKHLDLFNFLQDGPIKADFWRLCVLYKYGGVYIDADAEPLISLQDFIDPLADFVTCSSYGSNYNPNFIMAKAGDEFIKLCIDTYIRMYDEKVPYSYWTYSIMTIFNSLLQLENYTKLSGIYYNKEGKAHQIIKEVKAEKFTDDYNEYNGISVFNNRYKNYDYMTHSFIEQ